MGGGVFQDFGMNEQEFRSRYQRRSRPRQEPQNANPVAQLIVQFMPIFLILSYLILSSLTTQSQYFNFSQTSKFSHKRITKNLNIVYYVERDFI